MKTLLVIQGGGAVGKMTVGEEVAKLTNLKLFHNHITVEIANHFYGFGESLNETDMKNHKNSFANLRDRLRLVVFDNVGRSYLPGLIHTGVMYYDDEKVWDIVFSYFNTFKEAARSISEEVKIYIAELKCSQEEQFKRNVSENRLNKKPSKRNLDWSRKDIENQILTKRLLANEDDIKRFNADGFISIDNTNIEAKEAALMIVEKFGLRKI